MSPFPDTAKLLETIKTEYCKNAQANSIQFGDALQRVNPPHKCTEGSSLLQSFLTNAENVIQGANNHIESTAVSKCDKNHIDNLKQQVEQMNEQLIKTQNQTRKLQEIRDHSGKVLQSERIKVQSCFKSTRTTFVFKGSKHTLGYLCGLSPPSPLPFDYDRSQVSSDEIKKDLWKQIEAVSGSTYL